MTQTKETIKKVWNQMELSCRHSIDPSYAKKFLEALGLELPKELIYTQNRYREQSNLKPRVDCEELLEFVFKAFDLKPNEEKLNSSERFYGEGTRRDAVEEAYLS